MALRRSLAPSQFNRRGGRLTRKLDNDNDGLSGECGDV